MQNQHPVKHLTVANDYRDKFRIVTNIQDGAFFKNS